MKIDIQSIEGVSDGDLQRLATEAGVRVKRHEGEWRIEGSPVGIGQFFLFLGDRYNLSITITDLTPMGPTPQPGTN